MLDPETVMLGQFNRSEEQRLLPLYRRIAWRLTLAALFVGVVGSYTLFLILESR